MHSVSSGQGLQVSVLLKPAAVLTTIHLMFGCEMKTCKRIEHRHPSANLQTDTNSKETLLNFCCSYVTPWCLNLK